MATTVAHRMSATRVSFTQMMMSGAMATIGVTCSSTAYGKKLISIQRLCTNSSAVAVPTTVASASAVSAICSVTKSEPASNARSAISVSRMRRGDGTM